MENECLARFAGVITPRLLTEADVCESVALVAELELADVALAESVADEDAAVLDAATEEELDESKLGGSTAAPLVPPVDASARFLIMRLSET